MPKASLYTFTLFAAAGLVLLSAFGVSCASGSPGAEKEISSANVDTVVFLDGLKLLQEERYELARERLAESALSDNIYIRMESFLYLNVLEMKLENYENAKGYLESYHAEAMRLFYRAMDKQQEMTGQMARLDRRHRRLVGGMIGAAALIAGGLLFFVSRWQRSERRRRGHPASTSPPFEISDWNRYLRDAEAFKQTSVFAEIAGLAGQPKDRDARVLSLARQEALDVELASRFAGFTARLASDYPQLTAGDLKLCCLSMTGLSSFGRAICFGSIETNIIKQRKHKIKGKIGDRAVFEFIFSQAGS